MKWDNEVISEARLERNEEQFRERFNHEVNQHGQVAEREFGGRPNERYGFML